MAPLITRPTTAIAPRSPATAITTTTNRMASQRSGPDRRTELNV